MSSQEDGPLRDLSGKSVSHYRILEKLGAGGMGEVYKAEDTKLGRMVALKFLPETLSQNRQALERFEREARAASALDHPNVCTIYEIGEHEGQPFIAMELVEGQTLAEKVKSGRLAIEEAAGIAAQVAEALEDAHEHHIIHRDLKPANVMVNAKGRVKVLDFGLAKLLRPVEPDAPTAESLLQTRAGAVMGTVPYMAPEQLRGEVTDARTDLYAWGGILYEMTTGQRPFPGAQTPQLIVAILTQPPPSPRQLNGQIPPELEAIMLKALAKAPAQRYQSARELLSDLPALAISQSHASVSNTPVRSPSEIPLRKAAPLAVAVGLALVVLAALLFLIIPLVRQRMGTSLSVFQQGLPREKELAVLPFSVIGGNAGDEAFSRGLSETLAAKLTQLAPGHSLQVVPAGDVFARHVATARQARQEFNVNLVLAGSLERAGDQVRISYELVDPSTDRQLKAAMVTVATTDPFAIEDRVVEGAAALLGLHVEPAQRQAVETHGTQRAAAFQDYLQGLGYLENYERVESIDEAVASFQSALKVDPAYALAYAGLGQAYWDKYEITNDTTWVDHAQQSCDRAVTLNADLPASHLCLGTSENGTGQYAKAVAEFQKVIEIEPTNIHAYSGLANAEFHLGKKADAEQTYLHAISIEPNYWGPYVWLGNFYWTAGEYPKAVQMFQKVTELAPENASGYNNLGITYYAQERWAEAEEMYKKSIAIHPSAIAFSNLGTLIFFQGHYAEAARAFEKATQLSPKDEALWGNLADAYRWAPGERDKAAPTYAKAIGLVEGDLRVNPQSADDWSHVALYRAKSGQVRAALEAVRQAVRLGAGNVVVNYYVALVYHLAGQRAESLQWLKRAVAMGYPAREIRADPEWNALRNDPQFEHLVQNPKH